MDYEKEILALRTELAAVRQEIEHRATEVHSALWSEVSRHTDEMRGVLDGQIERVDQKVTAVIGTLRSNAATLESWLPKGQ
jgi:hypothetical protein